MPSLFVEFRKRLTAGILDEINEMIIEFNAPDENVPEDAQGGKINRGTLMIDATCAPQNIKFPQDICLLNEAREGRPSFRVPCICVKCFSLNTTTI